MKRNIVLKQELSQPDPAAVRSAIAAAQAEVEKAKAEAEKAKVEAEKAKAEAEEARAEAELAKDRPTKSISTHVRLQQSGSRKGKGRG